MTKATQRQAHKERMAAKKAARAAGIPDVIKASKRYAPLVDHKASGVPTFRYMEPFQMVLATDPITGNLLLTPYFMSTPKGPVPNKYTPHQGKREIVRRRAHNDRLPVGRRAIERIRDAAWDYYGTTQESEAALNVVIPYAMGCWYAEQAGASNHGFLDLDRTVFGVAFDLKTSVPWLAPVPIGMLERIVRNIRRTHVAAHRKTKEAAE